MGKRRHTPYLWEDFDSVQEATGGSVGDAVENPGNGELLPRPIGFGSETDREYRNTKGWPPTDRGVLDHGGGYVGNIVGSYGYSGGYARCKLTHDGLTKVWASSCKTVTLGGAQGALLHGNEGVLVLDCAGMYRPRTTPFVKMPDGTVFTPELAQTIGGLNQHMVKPCPTIELTWPDRGIPPMGIRFWYDLWDILVTHFPGHVVVACAGSHGRTGTALASLIIADSDLSGDAATKWVRKHHCKEAIEGAAQEDYLIALAKERDAQVE